MTLAQLVLLALTVSIMVIVFALGLTTRLADLSFLVRRPWLLVRSLTAMNVVMPLFAIAVIRLLHPGAPTSEALIALSLSPVPPILPGKQTKAGGDRPFAVGLLVLASLFAIVWIPVAMEIVEWVFGVPLAVKPMDVVKVVGRTILAPLAAGILISHFARNLAARAAAPLARFGGLVLALGALMLLFKTWQAMAAQIGNGTVWALLAFIAVGLLLGHLLGGPDEGDRTVLATAVASRHPGLAITLAHLNFPDEHAVPAVVLLYLILSALISMPYVRWRRRLAATATAPAAVGR
jgi:BASS family bile acid:Na+ symporter